MGNDPFTIAVVALVGLSVLAVIVMSAWPFGWVPQGKIGVETVGDERFAAVVPQGERGIQSRLLPTGTRYFRWRRSVTFHDMVVIRDGCVGVVTAQVGIESHDKIAKYSPLFGHFDAVEAFLAHGGQRGVQAFLLPPGTYAIHPNAFSVVECDQVVIPEEALGVITAHIGVESTDGTAHYDHRFGDFTDVNTFLEAGGRQGVQEPFLRPGIYAIHPNAFEVVVISTDTDVDHEVFGDLSDATALLDTHDVSSVQTERGTALVVELENPSLTAQAVGQGHTDLSVERILLLVIRPTRDVAIEWEVAVGVDLIDPEKTVIQVLNSLVREVLGYGTWSLLEFISKLAQVDEQMRGLYRARINEAVMLPTSTVWARQN